MDSSNLYMKRVTNWNGYTQYGANTAVIYNNNLYFSMQSVAGTNPVDGFGTYWIDTSCFIWMPTQKATQAPKFINQTATVGQIAMASQVSKNNPLNYIKMVVPDGTPPNSYFVPLISRISSKDYATLLTFNMSFELRSYDEATSILAFFEWLQGTNSFYFLLQQPYNKVMKCICPNWRHTYVSYNNIKIEAQFEEIL